MKLCFLGDFCLAGDVENKLDAAPDYNPMRGLYGHIDDDDVVVANVECAITDRGTPLPHKYATLRSNPSIVAAMKTLDVAVLANNHVSDFGNVGAKDTTEHLQRAGIATTGYGKDLDAAIKPAIVKRDDATAAIVSFSCLSTNGQNYASPCEPGVPPLSTRLLRQTIEKLRKSVDAIFVYMHWGVEQEHYPVAEQMRLGRRAIDFGANVVIGSHAHVIQSYEPYNGGWIFHGLGNFIMADVPWSLTKPDGTNTSGVHRQKRENKQSLAVRFSVRSGSKSPVELEDVIPLQFDSQLIPRRVDKNGLTVALDELLENTSKLASTGERLWKGRHEISYRTSYADSHFGHYYAHPPIDKDPRCRRFAVLRSISRDLFAPLKKRTA